MDYEIFLMKRKSPLLISAATALCQLQSKRNYLHSTTPLISKSITNGNRILNIHYKLENMQQSGSFKDRGIGHMISTLLEEGGVNMLVSSSGGNGKLFLKYEKLSCLQ